MSNAKQEAERQWRAQRMMAEEVDLLLARLKAEKEAGKNSVRLVANTAKPKQEK